MSSAFYIIWYKNYFDNNDLKIVLIKQSYAKMKLLYSNLFMDILRIDKVIFVCILGNDDMLHICTTGSDPK